MDGSLRGVPAGTQPIWLDPKFPAAVALCRYEISRLDAQILTGLSLSAAPSGTGELAISALAYGAGIVTFKASGGQPGRTYSLMLSATRSDQAGFASFSLWRGSLDRLTQLLGWRP